MTSIDDLLSMFRQEGPLQTSYPIQMSYSVLARYSRLQDRNGFGFDERFRIFPWRPEEGALASRCISERALGSVSAN